MVLKELYLICNSHLDPVWLWEWEEGAAEALSTFRIAADFCEEYDNFVFNHNEVILYEWIEEYDPLLFARIQKLVKQGKWHIMSGWYLQTDCVMPSGESMVRQALVGRHYFEEKFGVIPTVALSFDAFGHNPGLVQILQKSGYEGYMLCRAGHYNDKENTDFVWKGFNDSELIVHWSTENYNSVLGKIGQELKVWIGENEKRDRGLFLWGVGNHGGGPSRKDLDDIKTLMADETQLEIKHSNPEAYFAGLDKASLPSYDKPLTPVASGCYTSIIRIKQMHRQLENLLFETEKMASSASMQGLMKYPKAELDEAQKALMKSQFHDALPGSAIQPVEDATLRLLGHGIEVCSNVRARAFFALTAGQEKVEIGKTPVMMYNPHPYPIKGIMECEFVLPWQNWDPTFKYPVLKINGKEVPCQAEEEHASFRIDWRKRAVFEAELEAGQMSRFDFEFKTCDKKPMSEMITEDGCIKLKTDDLEVHINAATGLMDKYAVDGVDYIAPNSFWPIVLEDGYNSWGGHFDKNNIIGRFALMDKVKGSEFSGLLERNVESVRVVEDGDVRIVVEAVLSFGDSFICQQYKIPRKGTEVQVDVRVFWNEKDRMLKLSVPTLLKDGKYMGQTAYGAYEVDDNGNEAVSQKWSAVVDGDVAVTCINDCIYGSNYRDGEMRLTLLRSAGYAASDFGGNCAIAPGRFTPRMDQGERFYSFWFNAGQSGPRMDVIDREALIRNEKPYALSYCPSGAGEIPKALYTLSDDVVQVTALKKAERSDDYIVRVFEPTGTARKTTLNIPAAGVALDIELNGFEVKSYKLNVQDKTIAEISLMEGII